MILQVLWISLQILTQITLTKTLLLTILSLFCRLVVDCEYFHTAARTAHYVSVNILVYNMHYNLKII